MLSWSDLDVTVSVKGKEKQLLQENRGFVASGQILAVMGASGAGKSTLFNVIGLRGKSRKFEVKGERHINGQAYDKRQLQDCSGFVPQHNQVHTHLTVVESLRTNAQLRLGRSHSKAERETKVQQLVDDLDLRRCENTRISGISGGESKRLAIGCALLNDPEFLFLDEPTSGLDAASSLGLFVLLRKLADRGCGIIVVIHQPRTSILDYVDNFLLLSCGKDLFFGPMPTLLEFFRNQGHPIPQHANPLDFCLDLVNSNEAMKAVALQVDAAGLRERSSLPLGGGANREEIAAGLTEAYRTSGIFETLWAQVTLADAAKVKNGAEAVPAVSGASFLTRLSALLLRETRSKFRNMDVLATQLLEAVLMGVILGTVYLQLSPGDSFNVSTSVALVTIMGVFLVFHVILFFPVERGIWLADNESGLYHSFEYYVSATVSALPGDTLASILMATIFYWLVGLRPDAGAFFIFVAFMILVGLCTSALFFFCSAIAPSMTTANTLASLVLLFVLLFNGVFIRGDQVPAVYAWIKEINYMAFANQGILYTQFRGLEVNCSQVYCDLQVLPGQVYGDVVLQALGISLDLNVGLNAVYSLVVLLVVHLLAFVAVTVCYTGFLPETYDRISLMIARKKEKKAAAEGPVAIRMEELDMIV